MTVMAIRTSGTNADLIADCAELGYLDEVRGIILDTTYGKGNFWTKFTPRWLHTNDIDPDTEAMTHADFRHLPFNDEWFGTVVFDPPYKLQGTSSNAGPASSNAAYGMDREYRPVTDSVQLFRDGLTECHRVLKSRGFLLYKCMDQVVSGDVEWTSVDAIDLMMGKHGCLLQDWLMLMGHRAQPERTRKCPACGGRASEMSYVDGAVPAVATRLCETCDNTGRVPSPQQHAARNYSSLLVFRKGRP